MLLQIASKSTPSTGEFRKDGKGRGRRRQNGEDKRHPAYCADRGERKIEACYVKASRDNSGLMTQALEDQATLPFQHPDLLATRIFEGPRFYGPPSSSTARCPPRDSRPARSPDAAPNALARLSQNGWLHGRLQNERPRPCASGAPAASQGPTDRFRSPAPSPRSPSLQCGEARDAESPRRHADQMSCRSNASFCMIGAQKPQDVGKIVSQRVFGPLPENTSAILGRSGLRCSLVRPQDFLFSVPCNIRRSGGNANPCAPPRGVRWLPESSKSRPHEVRPDLRSLF